jgi:hypothetical protein
MSIRAALCVALLAQSLPVGQARAAQHDDATRFTEMHKLVGTWRVAGRPNSPLRIRFSLTAGGTVLVESWSRNDQPHSLTLYHRDAAAIVATHYCPQGNQPRLTSLAKTADGVLRFAFRDATDLDPTRESYLVALAFDLPQEGVLVRRETYRQKGVDEASELRLEREP